MLRTSRRTDSPEQCEDSRPGHSRKTQTAVLSMRKQVVGSSCGQGRKKNSCVSRAQSGN